MANCPLCLGAGVVPYLLKEGWGKGKWPECRECHTTTFKHVGRGLCSPCFSKWYRNLNKHRLKVKAIKKAEQVKRETLTIEELKKRANANIVSQLPSRDI